MHIWRRHLRCLQNRLQADGTLAWTFAMMKPKPRAPKLIKNHVLLLHNVRCLPIGIQTRRRRLCDVCDDDARPRARVPTKVNAPGVASTACGACLSGFKPDGDACVDVCDDAAKNTCSSANKQPCSEGVASTTCGACKAGFKEDGDICVDVCDDGAKATCFSTNKEACSPLTQSAVHVWTVSSQTVITA